MKFWRMGTGHGAYVKRIAEKYAGVKSFTKTVIDERKKIEMVDDKSDRVIDTFTSEATAQQFLVVAAALGFFERATNGTYKVLCDHYDYDRVTEFIFTKSDNEKVQRYRTSRILCCLACLNLLDLFDFTKDVEMIRSKKEAVSETFTPEKSIWEIETISDKERTNSFLRMVKRWQQ